MFKLDLEKAEESEIKLPTSVRSLKMQESSRKTSTQFVIHTVKGFSIVNEAKEDVFWNSLAFTMIQRMLAI